MQMKKLYNLLALLIRKILNNMKERDFERLRNLEEEYEIEIIKKLKSKFPDLYDQEARNVAEFSEYQLNGSSLICDLEREINVIDSPEELVFLARCMDSFLEDTYYDLIPFDEDWYQFEGLNDNMKECGICLLPRVRCSWEHKSRDAYTSYSMFYYLRNFYYVCLEDMGEYKVNHILMPRSIFRKAMERGELRIAVSPVTCKKVIETEDPYERDHTRCFSVKPMECVIEEVVQSMIFQILKRASMDEIDILLFPEMLGTDRILESIKYELDIRERLPFNEFPRLTVCPSVWHNNRNSCKVLDDTGEVIMEQQKHHGVDLKSLAAKEDIMSDREIYVLHCLGIGRVAVAICKDFLITSYLGILAEKLRVNLLLVPSFTPVDYQFEVNAQKYGDLDCSVIWVNTCSAYGTNDNGDVLPSVTYAYLAGRKGITMNKKTVNDLCGGQYRCSERCFHVHRILFEKGARV